MACLSGARLQMLEKEEDKVVREIPVRTSQVQIGKNPTKNTIRLNSAGVEEFHCKIFVKNDKVFIANYSAKNPISVDKTVVPKRATLTDGSILEICGTRFRWKFDDSKLAQSEKAKKTERTPTSSKFGNRRRTTLARKKQSAAVVAATGGGSGKKAAAKKTAQQKTPTYTLPKNHKQLMKNIRKRFTVHNIMTRQNSEDNADEEDMECEDSVNLIEPHKQAESPKPVTPQKSSSAASSVANTPFYTPEPEKENSVPVSQTPRTPMLQLENSAMMILSYTPAIGSRSKANIQKTPLSVAKNAQRLNYLTPKNENIAVSGTPQKSKAGNSMYLIDLTTPTSGHSSFVCSPMFDTSTSSVGTPKVGLIDLTTPSPKMAKTSASALKSTQQKTLLKSALKNASRTPRTALRTATGTPATPKTVPKINLNDTPTKSATSTRSNKTPAGGSTRGGSIRSKLETPISSKKLLDSARKEEASSTPTVVQPELTEPKDAPIMTTDELFDTLVGRQSAVKTYERKSTSPKKTPCPLVLAEDTTEMPKTDIDLWVESVVAAVTSPESVNMDAIIRKPNQTTQVRSSQYSDITPHESFAEGTATARTSEVIEPQPESADVDVSDSPDELDNMTDKPTIPNSSRRSETPLASKIARSLGNKRQTIGNFFTNIFGKLTVSPVTRISIADDSTNSSADQEQTNGEDSDGSEEVYHDSESSHAADAPLEQPAEDAVATSPKLRQSLRDTRKFIGNAWTSLNTSRPQLDNTAEIDESLLLSDTYNETQNDAPNESATSEVYDLTDLGSRPTTAQPPVSTAKTPTQRCSVQSAGAFDISPLATPLESTPNKSVLLQDLVRDETGSFVISPDVAATPPPSTPVSRRSQQNVTPTSRRSTRRQTVQPTVSEDASVAELDGASVSNPVVEFVGTDTAEDASQELEPSIPVLPNQSRNGEVNQTSESLNQTNPVEGETEKIDVTHSEEQVISGELRANNTTLEHLDTSEMEPLEVTDGHESVSEVCMPGTPPSKDLVGSRLATRNSIATIQAFTPKAAAATPEKIPLSETKLPLRSMRKTSQTPVKTPPKTVDEFSPEINLLQDSIMHNKDQVAKDADSADEQFCEAKNSGDSCLDKVDVIINEVEESEKVPRDEISLSQVDLPSTPLEVSQTTVDPSVSCNDEPAEQESAVDAPVDQEQTLNAAARRSTRKSLATVMATPKSAAKSPLIKFAMSESKLPLRRLRTTDSHKLDQNVEETPTQQALDDCNVTAVEPQAVDSSSVENIPRTPSTPKASDQSSPGRSSRSSARSTPNKAASSTPKSTPSGKTPLLKRVLQKVATNAANSTPTPKPETNESEPDQSLQLDQLYQTPPLRVTRGKATKTSTPNIADASLNLDELYKTPVRTTRGNAATPTSAQSLAATPNDLNDESLASSSLHLDNNYSTPSLSTTAHHDPFEYKLESSGVDKSMNQQEFSKTPAKAPQTQLPEVAETIRESASPMTEDEMSLNQTPTTEQESEAKIVETHEQSVVDETSRNHQDGEAFVEDDSVELEQNVDKSLNLQELYNTPAKILRTNIQLQSASKTSETPKEGLTQVDVSLNLKELYNTPSRPTRHSSAIKSTPSAVAASMAEVDVSVEQQPSTDMSINPQELCKTPAKVQITNAQQPRVKNSETPKEGADVSLNLQQLFKTPARSIRQSSVVKGKLQYSVAADVSQVEDEPLKPQPTTVKQSETPKIDAAQADVSLNLQQLYKTPARTTRQSTVVKNTSQSAVVVDASKVEDEPLKPQPTADMSLNLQETYKTPARAEGSNAQQSAVKQSGTPKIDAAQADVSLNLHQLYKTPVRSTRQSTMVKNTPQSSVVVDKVVNTQQNADVSLNQQELYKTPARGVGLNAQQSTVKNSETPKDGAVQADVSLNLQQLYKTPARPTRQSTMFKNTPQSSVVVDASQVKDEPLKSQPTADVSLNLQELYKTPARAVKNSGTPMEGAVLADVSLNLQVLYKTPVRSTRQSSVVKSTPPAKNADAGKVDEEVNPQQNADVSPNLQELYKTPARTKRLLTAVRSQNVAVDAEQDKTPKESAVQADVNLSLQQSNLATQISSYTAVQSSPQSFVNADVSRTDVEPLPNVDMSLNLHQLYKTPVGPTRQSPVVKSTPSADAVEADITLNLHEMYTTPAHTLQQSAVKNSATPKESALKADVSLNLEPLYKTPARSTRQSSVIKGTPQPTVDVDVSMADADDAVDPPLNADVSADMPKLYNTPVRSLCVDTNSCETPKEGVVQADVSLNLQELYKTPARILRGVSQLTPAAGVTPAMGAVERDADLSLNLEQMYKTPARALRGTTQLSAMKPAKVSDVTPHKTLEKSAVDVTPTAESSKVERTPIAKVSETEPNMTLNLDQMYQTPARQSLVEVTELSTAETDMSLNLDQVYKTPARTLCGVTQLAASTPATEQKAETEVSLNLEELYKTPARTLRTQTPQKESADTSLNLQELYKTPAQTKQVVDTTVQAAVDESNSNVESLFKTPASTTRGRLPRSTAKVTPQTVITTPHRTSRSAKKGALSAQEQPSVLSIVESELASSIVGESIDMGSESDGLVTGKAITSSTPFNPRTRKSTLVAAVGMMSPLNSSGDSTTSSEIHTEAIGITTIDSSAVDSTTTAVDQMQTMAGVFVAAQSRLFYDESGMETLQGDPLQVTNAVSDITCAVDCVDTTQLNETTQRTVAESLLEQNKTLVEATIFEQATVDASKAAGLSTVLTTTVDVEIDVDESVQNALPAAEVGTPPKNLRGTAQSPAINIGESPVGNKSVVECTPADKPKVDEEQKSPAQLAGTPLSTSVSIVESEAVQGSSIASPEGPSTPATGINKSTSEMPKLMSPRESTTRLSTASTKSRQSTTPNASKQRVSVTANISINEQEHVDVPKLHENSIEASVDSTLTAEGKCADNVSDVSVFVESNNAPSLISEKMDDESIPKQSVAIVSAVPICSDATSDTVNTTKESEVATTTYLDSLGVDSALLQQIHERVDTLERELAEMNDLTQGSSTFLERSDEQSLESEIDAKLQDSAQTPKPMKRRLYTKIAPDESTPERRESIGDQRVTSFYTESDSDRKAVDTSTEVEEPKRVEPVKVLPSRASRRKITTLSEEALAGASPELKFVKPKQPKVFATEDPPQVDTSDNASEVEQSDQETSLGRRKVVFNDEIQIKEINSPAFIGEIIKKTTLRGRGRNNKQAVTVTVDKNPGQTIKPATKRGKAFESEEVTIPQDGTSTASVTEVVADNVVESVEPDRILPGEELPKPSEEIVEPPVNEPPAKRSRAKKVPATKRTASKQKIPVEDEFEVDSKDPQEETSTAAVIETGSDKAKLEPLKPFDEIVHESAAKRSRSKKAPVTKRTGSRQKVPVESATKDENEAKTNVYPEEASTADATETILDKVDTIEDEVEPAKIPKKIDEVPVDEPAAKRSGSKRAPVTKRAASRKKDPVESVVENVVKVDPQERAAVTEDVSEKVETVEVEVNPEDSVLKDPPKQSEEIDKPAAKPSRVKKAAVTKRAGSRKKAPVESISEVEIDQTDFQERISTAASPDVVLDIVEAAAENKVVKEPPKKSGEIVETSDDEPTTKRGHAKKTPASKRTGSRTKVDSKEEQTSTISEGKNDEIEAVPVKVSSKRSRRRAKDTLDVIETVVKEPTVTVDEPVSKRVRHANEPTTEAALETTVEEPTNEAEETDDAQSKVTTKATIRSRRGKKQSPTKSNAVQVELEANGTEQVSKSTEVKLRSRRRGKKNDLPAEKVPSEIKEPEAAGNSSKAAAEEKVDSSEVMKPVEQKVIDATIEAHNDSQTEIEAQSTTEAKAKPRSRRGAREKTAPTEEATQAQNSPAEVQETDNGKTSISDPKPSEDVKTAVGHEKEKDEEQKSVSHNKAAVKKGPRRGRGTARNDTVEPSDVSEAAASLTVEKAIADSTSHDEPSVATVDVKSGAKRSRRGAAKDEAEPVETASVEQVNEPESKRSRRAPKSKVTEEAHSETAEAVPKPAGRSRHGQKQEAAIAAETDSSVSVDKSSIVGNKNAEASKVEESEIVEKPTSRGRAAKNKTAEEQSSARMPSPTLPPPAVDVQPAKRKGRQAAKRAPKKASNPDPVPVEMSMNESHMVKTMLPASHTSTPLIKNALNADTAEVPSGTRGRRAATNPVIAALIEESTPRSRGRRGGSATPDVQVETPSTPAKRGRGRGAAKAVEEETQSSTGVDESEPSTSTAPSCGKKIAKEVQEVIQEDEPAVEAEPVTKRTRKAPAKFRDEDDTKPSRGRHTAKAKTEVSIAAVADDEASSSAGPSEEKPKRKPRTAAAKRTVKKKEADLNEESLPEEKEEEAPKSPPPKRTRKGAR